MGGHWRNDEQHLPVDSSSSQAALASSEEQGHWDLTDNFPEGHEAQSVQERVPVVARWRVQCPVAAATVYCASTRTGLNTIAIDTYASNVPWSSSWPLSLPFFSVWSHPDGKMVGLRAPGQEKDERTSESSSSSADKYFELCCCNKRQYTSRRHWHQYAPHRYAAPHSSQEEGGAGC